MLKLKLKPKTLTDSDYERLYSHFESCGYDLYDYQREGVRFMATRETDPSYRSASLLCDEPGLGKTIQTGALMWINPKSTTLLVLPKCVVSQWRDFLKVIFPEEDIYIHHGTKRCKSLEDLQEKLLTTRIVLTTFGTLKHLLLKIKWGRIIYDEVHYLRNPKTTRSVVAQNMRADCYLGLTGTIINNCINDIRTVYKVLNFPEAVLEKTAGEYFDELNRKYIIRRTKGDVCVENPRLNLDSIDFRVIKTPFFFKEEREIHNSVMSQIYSKFGNNPDWSLVPLEHIMRMRQACVHPRLVEHGFEKKFGVNIVSDEDLRVKSTKFEIIREMVHSHPDEKSLIFSHYREEMDIITHVLEVSGVTVYRIDGSLSIAERETVVRDFGEDEDTNCVMIIQISAGSVGINLQSASRVYITSPHYNPSVEIQAIARAHRIGQTRKVHVVKLAIADDGFVETRILEAQMRKREIMSIVLDDKRLEDNGREEKLSPHIASVLSQSSSNEFIPCRIVDPYEVSTEESDY